MDILIGSVKGKLMEHDFLVPDYYQEFSCKGDKCRNTCCSRWKVTIPMDEYFRLHGIQCEANLKDRIDRAFRPVYSPTPESYAEMVHNYKGNCPLLMANGYCQLHSQCGESALPTVCRMYPRSIHVDAVFEASCANSCERTLELLFDREDPITFKHMKMPYQTRESKESVLGADEPFYTPLRKACFDILANRNYPLVRRITRLGRLFKALDVDIYHDPHIIPWSEMDDAKGDILYTRQIVSDITSWYRQHNPVLAEILFEVDTYYDSGEIGLRHLEAVNHFNELFPAHEIMFEKIIINQLFYKQFPFQTNFKTFYDEFIGLAGLYMILKYVSVSLMSDRNTLESYIDLLAKLFRVISHSKFEYNIMVLLKNEGIESIDEITRLISI